MSETISLKLFVKGFKEHLRQILIITAVVLFLAVLGALFVYHDSYSSTTLVHFDRGSSPSVQLRDYISDGSASIESIDFNFLKSQLQLLKSDSVRDDLYNRVKQEKDLVKRLKITSPARLESLVKAELLKETDIIALSGKAHSPKDAQRLSQLYAETYQEVSTNTYFKPTLLKKEVIEKKIAEVQVNLDEKTAQLSKYQQEVGIADPIQEKAESSTHLEALRREDEDLVARISAAKSELGRLRSQIGMNSRASLNAVAVGHDTVYASLENELTEAEKEYQAQQPIYTDNHPYMVRLKGRIAALKGQMAQVSAGTIGVKGVNRVIRDSVRANLVERASLLEAQMQGLIAQDMQKRNQLRDLSERVAFLPSKGMAIEQLKSQVDGLSAVLGQLQTSLEDLRLQLSYGKVYLYSNASMPGAADFPSAFQLPFLLAAVAFAFSSFVAGAYEHYRQSQFCSLTVLNEKFNIPTLAVVPWIGPFDPSFVSMELFGHVFNAFALRLKCEKMKTGHRTYVLTSVQSQGSQRFTALKSLAVSLAKTGDKVLIMETGLWPGSLRQEFFQQIDFSSSIPLNELLELNLVSLKKKITSNIYALNLNTNVYFLDLFTENAVDSFSMLSTPAFKQIIELLKLEFDWILCDSPSLSRHSETFALINSFDSMVLLVERDTPKGNAYQAIKQLQNMGGHIAGLAVRNIGT